MKKILIFASLLIIALVLTAVMYFKSLAPNYNGTFALKGLSKKVEVIRDQWGIPYLRAKNMVDLYQAFGFTHAQDRLFQMDAMRRLASGKLAEVLGEKVLPLDQKMRTLRIARHIRELRERKPQMFQGKWMDYYEAYCRGINQYVETGPLPPEFKILGYKPEPFTPDELMPIAGYMALTFAHGLKVDSLMTHLAGKLNTGQMKELVKGYPDHAPTILSHHTTPMPGLEKWSDILNELQNESGYFYGSNSWIVGPSRSKTGAPMLVNDPHIRFVNPSIWFEAQLETESYKVHGFFLAGFPFPLLGHNQDHAYGLTMLENDDMDLYEETISEDGKSCLYKGRWLPMQIEKELIKIKGRKEPKEFLVRSTPHGPVVSDFLPTKLKNKAISLNWLFYHPENRIFEAFYGLSSSKSPKEFQTAVSKIASPGLNISYVDAKGNIGYWAAGKLPINSPSTPSKILLDGSRGQHEINGFHPFEKNPRAWNPEKGFIYTANNKPIESDMIRGYFMPRDRASRIIELIIAGQQLSPVDMEAIQTDSVLITARLGVPKILKALSGKKLKQKQQDTINLLAKWDLRHETNRVGAAIFQEWIHQFLGVLLDPALGTNSSSYKKLHLARHFVTSVLERGDSSFLKAQNLSFEKAVEIALIKTCESLTKRLGPEIKDWTWGKIHTIEYNHPLGKVWPLNLIFNIGPFPAPGVKESINSVGSTYSDDRFQVRSGPSTRRIITFHDIDQSKAILPTGNSGNVLSEHYDDQAELFLKNGYRTIPFTKKAVDMAARYNMSLIPGS